MNTELKSWSTLLFEIRIHLDVESKQHHFINGLSLFTETQCMYLSYPTYNKIVESIRSGADPINLIVDFWPGGSNRMLAEALEYMASHYDERDCLSEKCDYYVKAKKPQKHKPSETVTFAPEDEPVPGFYVDERCWPSVETLDALRLRARGTERDCLDDKAKKPQKHKPVDDSARVYNPNMPIEAKRLDALHESIEPYDWRNVLDRMYEPKHSGEGDE